MSDRLLTITVTEDDAKAVMAMAWAHTRNVEWPSDRTEAKKILRRVDQEIESARENV